MIFDDATLTLVLSIAVLLVLSGFFSGSETALTAASNPLMHQLEQKGSKRAAIVNRLYDQKDRLIGAILLGNNLVNILASALATSALLKIFGEAGVAYATVAMTLLILIFSEILPKTYAFKYANRTALMVAPAINAVVTVLAPVTNTLQLVVSGLLRLFRLDSSDAEGLGSNPEELRGAIELHSGHSESVKHERAMLRSVLDLNEVWASQIMTHRSDMATVNIDQQIDAIIDQVMDSPYTRIPVWRGSPDEVIGVLHVKALLRAMRSSLKNGGTTADLPALETIAVDPWFIPESTTLLDQLQAFRERHEHFALVVDEYGALQGLVTLEDILEEIVGEISDEHDISVAGVRPQSDGSYLVQGMVTIRDLNRELGWNLPDEEADTVAGMVLHESRRIPNVGQTFLFHDFRFEIVRRQRHRIALVRITAPAEDDE